MSAASIVLIKMKRYIRRFRSAGAISPDTAINPEAHGIRKSMIFHRLVRHGVLVLVHDQLYYLDEAREAVVRKRRQLIAAVVVVILIIGLLVVWATTK